jgi:hypothetical protein
MAEIATRLLLDAGWEVQPEVSFSHFGERGVVDLVAWHPLHQDVALVELKTELADVNDLLAVTGRRRRLAGVIGEQFGWRPETVAQWVVLAPSRTNARRVAEHRTLLRAAFPSDGRAIGAGSPDRSPHFSSLVPAELARGETWADSRARHACSRPAPSAGGQARLPSDHGSTRKGRVLPPDRAPRLTGCDIGRIADPNCRQPRPTSHGLRDRQDRRQKGCERPSIEPGPCRTGRHLPFDPRDIQGPGNNERRRPERRRSSAPGPRTWRPFSDQL